MRLGEGSVAPLRVETTKEDFVESARVPRAAQKVNVDDVEGPRIERPTDAVVRITSTNICVSDLHMYEDSDAYEHLDKRAGGWTKVVLHPV